MPPKQSADDRLAHIDGHFSYTPDKTAGDYVKELSPIMTPATAAKLVALYLPQFYPIEENDRWWGKGFTEWTNVTRARPQFVGHYQPRLPADLGFYDLRLPQVQEQQATMAKTAGVDAFCFYFYWFGGKTLLETPIRNFANNPNIDLEFCLCWANDDWSRTWTGNSNDILISQNYSPDDDIAFITHLSQYLKNDRYLRVDGKPLINVWRPTMIPDPAATVQRWRDWCDANGIGPIHVSCSQTYERLDPAEHGMDSAYQHSPGDTRWIEPNIATYAEPLEWLNPNFDGKIFDYRDLVRRARAFQRPAYRLFRSVCPSWDNEARRPGKGRTLVGADPKSYLSYLETTLEEVEARKTALGSEVVLLNAWNEWGEGAHLEPDRRYGYANLEATRMARLRVALRHDQEAESQRVAIVVHAYYDDLLEECLGWLSRDRLDFPHDIIITAPLDKIPAIEGFLASRGLSAAVLPVVNRGRDVAPFLKALRSLDYRRYGRILKLHTKRSGGGALGHSWRQSLYKMLANADGVKAALAMLDRHSDIGVIGPSEHLLSMQQFLGRNESMVRQLAERMGVFDIQPASDAFFAGTMFLARTKALLPLAALGIASDEFELEEGQVNGTLAHAIERAVTYSAHAAGLKVAAFNADASDGRSHLIHEGRLSFPYLDKAAG